MKVLFWTNALSIAIVAMNYVLREVCIALINWIGYKTETKRLVRTTMVTFYVLFLNTAFLLLLVNAYFIEQPLISFKEESDAAYSDFSMNWFRDTGNLIIATMIFNAYYPPLEFLMYWGMRIFYRMLDSSCTFKKYKTKSTSIHGYLDVRAGPDYLMHFKYSTILNSVFVTFMFGFGIPILFPIAAFTFWIIYVIEKASFYYSYRVPPSYDEKLSQAVLDTLMWAPLFYLGFGYWMASSKQLLSNDYLETSNKEALERASAVFESQHLWTSVFTPAGWAAPAWPMIFTFFVVLSFCLFGGLIFSQLKKISPFFKIGDVEIDENLPDYWDALDDVDKNWSYKEEENMRENYDVKCLLDDDFKDLKARMGRKHECERKTIKGAHTYDILANPIYIKYFQYISAAQVDPPRSDFIKDGDNDEGNDYLQMDMVRLALNAGFIRGPFRAKIEEGDPKASGTKIN